MKKLWVIEANFSNGTVDICDFGDRQFAFTNFYKAHAMKREIQKYLFGISKRWKKDNIKVRRYYRYQKKI